MEPKQNIIMDGTFSKIIFSNEFFALNGLFFFLPIQHQTIDCYMNKYIMKFYPSGPANVPIVQQLSKIEYSIIEYYKEIHHCKKRTSCILTKQLYSGNLKIFKDMVSGKPRSNSANKYIIKIAGIWETHEEVGITYKVMECF